ncbi:MAG TPA: D-alanyl-D-alanine carboxypeptidase/D-alanyl-D-alanine-endopeptidase [Solirubrobacteraceae bacterium]|nr:D-alanyl-D-alanine carboxypeptidase/D-alanyl-D-alanine-endopeptidase [Solirubrobacteraceae bacterium]
MRRVVLTWGAVLLALVLAPVAASAQSLPAANQSLTNALNGGMRKIGGASSAYVVDLTTGQPLYSDAAGTGRMPASVEKLYTTSTALLEFGPAATLSTTVWGAGSVSPSGAWTGTLYLRGGGDPTFGSASFDRSAYGAGATVQRLVSSLVQSLHLTSVQGEIVGDQTYFDSKRGTPATHYAGDIPDVEGLLGGLAYDRGYANWTGTAAQRRPALYAAQQFAAALRSAKVSVPSSTRIYTGQVPSDATELAAVQSPPMSKLIQLTNTPSDNYLAEMLLKGLGARFGGAGTTAAGAAVVKQEVSSHFGIAPVLNDGSGLSRADSTSPLQVVTLLQQIYGNSDFYNSLAIAGKTGTLEHEARGTAAQGVCHAKTGTLRDVAALAGYCQARDGHELAFAFLANRIGNPDYVHGVEANTMAAALAKYDG